VPTDAFQDYFRYDADVIDNSPDAQADGMNLTLV
jgi:hypothetical protein